MRNDTQLWSLQRGLDQWFDDFALRGATSARPTLSAPCDIEESEDEFLLTLDLPGVAIADVRIESVDQTLTIAGKRHGMKSGENRATHFTERRHGEFERVFTLPANVDADRIEADYQDGVLRIVVPKSEKAKSRTIRVGESKSGGVFDRLLGRKAEAKASSAQPEKVA